MENALKQKAQDILSHADIQINGSRPWDMQVKDERVYARTLAEGSLGLGESYINGWWDVQELDEFFNRLLRARLDKHVKPTRLFVDHVRARLINGQTRSRSKVVAETHYDLGNDFYAKVLDKRMLYTCAYWKSAHTLEEAQENKLELICKKIMLKKSDRVLDLGCGWGSFAKYAAEKYGCQITSVNISEQQLAYARESCKGLPVELIKSDYRDIGSGFNGAFDKVVAIGLCEHVGYKNYRSLMKVAFDAMKDGGLFLLHTIGTSVSGVTGDAWLDKYIFPGHLLPSVKQLAEAAEGLFVTEDLHNFGPDYDKTLVAWWQNFDKHWPQFKDKFDDRFYRIWKYYLLMCAGTFRARYNQLWQFIYSKGSFDGGYTAVR